MRRIEILILILLSAWKDRGTTGTEADGAWHHIVAVYPDAAARHVYVNGVLAEIV